VSDQSRQIILSAIKMRNDEILIDMRLPEVDKLEQRKQRQLSLMVAFATNISCTKRQRLIAYYLK